MTQSTVVRSVGQRIRTLLDERGMKQIDLADRIGMRPLALSRRLNRIVRFTLDEITAIAQALNVSVAELVEEEDR
jgi:transcriptional regulator with XRE-family HTH domain